MRVFIREVGFVDGLVVRRAGRFLGVQFNSSPSVERHLLIRKLFTAGLDTANVETSVWSATGAMLKSIWRLRTEVTEADAAPVEQAAATPSREKLPAQSLVIPPQPHVAHLSELVEKRRSMAA